MNSLFHLAFHVSNLEQAREFYVSALGCREGRSTDTWIDFDLCGHQISLHLGTPFPTENTGLVGTQRVPMPHFGVILSMKDWKVMAQRLKDHGAAFVLEPSIRFAGEAGEQATLFIKDPAGNAIEIKGFADLNEVYAR